VRKKVFVLGLDCASPDLLFKEFLNELPTFKKLIEGGVWGKLRSCIPPITIPAWMVMVTGENPGRLGLYGFRHRENRSYTGMWIATSNSVKEKKIWDFLEERGLKSILVAVPPSYPPYPVNGYLVSCFLTPDSTSDYTFPCELKGEIEESVGEYIPDVPFRVEEKKSLLEDIYLMGERRFEIIKYLLKEKDWDFFMCVDIGLDRVQHAYWRYFDSHHHLYEPDSPFAEVIKDYYRFLDNELAEILEIIPDDTYIFVTSDHGAKRMKGAICVNDWLAEEGYLVFKTPPKEIVRPEKAEINWEKTRAWAWGGYYSRIFVNLQGREENGVVKPEEYEKLRDELKEKLASLTGPNGEKLQNKVYKPEEVYPILKGEPPDLMVFFDDLSYRAAGTMGHKEIYLAENDTGPDDAVHEWDGVFIAYHPSIEKKGNIHARIEDIAPTILNIFGLNSSFDFDGKIIEEVGE
jgi:predicted AlkP superfamily phosphohydrolase/phosphomutase